MKNRYYSIHYYCNEYGIFKYNIEQREFIRMKGDFELIELGGNECIEYYHDAEDDAEIIARAELTLDEINYNTR